MKNTVEAKLAYRENAVGGASAIELVVVLFDVAIDDMRRAASAIQPADIEERGQAIRHAMLVLQQLQGTLDFERGGEVARRFEQFYNLIRGKLLEAPQLAAAYETADPVHGGSSGVLDARRETDETETQP